jgi:hypothetical protein
MLGLLIPKEQTMITLDEIENRIANATETPRDDTMRRVITVAHGAGFGIGLPRLDEDGEYPDGYPFTVEQLRAYETDEPTGDRIVAAAQAS